MDLKIYHMLRALLKRPQSKPVYILKSTVLPGTTESLSKKYSNIKIIFSPEFLTERTAKLDMLDSIQNYFRWGVIAH